MRRLLAVSALLLLAFATPASAHQGDAHFLSTLNQLSPATDGLSLEVLNYGTDLQLTNHTGKTVTVMGYNDEPYARLLPDGTVEVNHNSPAYYLNQDTYGTATVPPGLDKNTAPDWQEVDKTSRFDWHDHRAHYMGKGVPPQVSNSAVQSKVFDWTVPLEVDGKPVDADGTLVWRPIGGGGPPVVAIGALLLITLVGGALVVVVRRRRSADDEVKEAW
ncbi:MAG: hypothetical protein QOG62_1001 [Thermoleophilaceae bacterium]|nr:hypothetical protein [Thermoleophilaceae bacterium]